MPTIEVRFEHLTVEAKVYLGSRALPTLLNFAINMLQVNRFFFLGNSGKSFTDYKNIRSTVTLILINLFKFSLWIGNGTLSSHFPK